MQYVLRMAAPRRYSLIITKGTPTSSKHVKAGHHRPSSETPFRWRFAGGPLVARDCILAGPMFVLLDSLTAFPSSSGRKTYFPYPLQLTEHPLACHPRPLLKHSRQHDLPQAYLEGSHDFNFYACCLIFHAFVVVC